MPSLDASATARLLLELSRRIVLAGGNPYKAKAYARAAESLATLALPLDEVIAAGRLQEIPGVGATIAGIIAKLHATGTHPTLEAMRQDVPESVLDLLAVPGLRPEKVALLHQSAGITSLSELEAAARAGRLATVKGIGPALQEKILQGLEIRRAARDARHMHRGAALLAAAEGDLARAYPDLTRIVAAGDVRRGTELVTDLSLVAEAPRLDGEPRTLNNGDLTVHLTDARRFGITLLHATGSAAHLAELREVAAAKGLVLGKDGLTRAGKVVSARTEAGIYRALGLEFVPPELREGRGEVALAAEQRLPKLVEAKDIRGILHAHTVASDGGATLEEMAEATRERGYEYFGVADHSQSAHYAGGLKPEAIARQHAEADRLNAAYAGRFRIFKGIESDIRADGSLDYADDVLRRFDFVVASVHSGFKTEPTAQTERIIRAVENPFTTILGHMTGRQLLRRPGYEVDIARIIAACAANGVAIEINANPWRLDLDWRWHGRALEAGCMLSINPDAHSTAEIDLVRWGVTMARKGGVPKTRVLNCLGRKAFARFLAERRARWEDGADSVGKGAASQD